MAHGMVRNSRSTIFLAAVMGIAAAASVHGQNLTANPASVAFAWQVGTGTPPQQTVQVTSPTPVNATIAVTTNPPGGNWLFAVPSGSTTPLTVSFIVLPGSLPVGTHTAQVTVNATGLAPLNIPISLIVSNNPILVASAQSLAFTFAQGGAAPAAQALVLGSTTPVSISAAAATNLGGNWLSVSPLAGTTPATLNVAVNPAGLPVGVYTGRVIIASAGAGNSPMEIPVTLTVADQITATVTPATLTFDFTIGGPDPAPRPVTIATTGANAAFSTVVTTATGGNWLSVAPSAGTTPANLTVTANPAGVAAGTHTGKITFTVAGASNAPQELNVTLRVSADPLLQSNPQSLTFTHTIGGSAPARQALVLSSIGPSVNATVLTITAAGGNWLSANLTQVATPGTLLISVAPGNLAAGVYQGTVRVTGTAVNSPFDIPVTFIVSAAATLRPNVGQIDFFHQAGATPVARTFNVASTGAPVNFTLAAATASGGQWLVVPTTATAPADISASFNPAGLTAGLYLGSITIKTTEANAPSIVIPVRLFISTNPMISVTPGPLSFSFTSGGALPANQTVTVNSTGAAINFTATAVAQTGGTWLVAAPLNGSSAAGVNQISVGVNTLGLGDGAYSGLLTINSPGAANSPQYIPVVLAVTQAIELVVPPAGLTFDHLLGSAAPVAQTIAVNSNPAIPIPFTAVAATLTPQVWLRVTPAGGLSGGTLTVTVDPTGLDAGIYQGTITITSVQAVNSPRIIPVTLRITRPLPTLVVNPASITFPAQPTPAPQTATLQATSTGVPIAFTVAAATANGGSWLSVTPASGATPTALTVTANPSGLATGTYNGTITLTTAGAVNSPLVVNVTFQVTATPPPVVASFTNGASFQPGAAAPGLIATLFGQNLGPAQLVAFTLTGGLVPTTVGNTRVLFDGIPAPVLYASAGQTACIVPYAVAGRATVQLTVEYQGIRSAPITLQVAGAQPAIFSANSSGTGPGAILNENGQLNTAANPAARESIVVIYATGEGQTGPAGVDGSVPGAGGVPLRAPILPVRVRIGGQDAEVLYAGSAPGLVSGVMQINARIRANAATGGNVPIEVTVGQFTSQFGVTIAVR